MGDLRDVLGVDGAMTGWICAGKAACLLVATGLMALGLKRRSAATRHLVWCLGLAGAVALLPLGLVLPRWGVPVFSASEPVTQATPVSEAREAPLSTSPALPEVETTRTVKAPAPQAVEMLPPPSTPGKPRSSMIGSLDLDTWLWIGWLVGSSLVVAWSAAGWVLTRRMGRRAERIEAPEWQELVIEAAGRLGVRRPVALRLGEQSLMPMTWGVFRPVVLLPREADGWPVERRRAVLLHELAHVRRLDGLTQWLGLAASVIYWFNPLAWWASSHLRAERERASDDLVLEAGERPSDYAEQLLNVARALRPAQVLSPAAFAMARPSGLEGRLRAILDVRCRRRGPSRLLVLSALSAVLGIAVPLAAVRLEARADGPKTKEAAGHRDAESEIEGRVVGPDGGSVAGASVTVLTYDEDFKPIVLGRANADADGRFRINPEPTEYRDRRVVVVSAPGFGIGMKEVKEVETPIRLDPERRTTVLLVDIQGAPVAGAEVGLTQFWSEGEGGWGLDDKMLAGIDPPGLSRSWTTDERGRLELRGLGPGRRVGLSVRASGFGRQDAEASTGEGDGPATATVVLSPGHAVQGRVTFRDSGMPAAGARVHVVSMSEPDGYGRLLGEEDLRTDAAGNFRVDLPLGRSVRATAYPPGDGTVGYLLQRRTIKTGEGMVSSADVSLPRGVLVRGRVVEAGSGRPVEGATVMHQAQSKNNPYYIKDAESWWSDGLKAKTGPDGTFSLAVNPGPGFLLVKGPTLDYIHQEISEVELYGELVWPNRRNYPDAFLKISPKPVDGPVEVALTVRRGTTVHGRLVGADGQPVRKVVMFGRWYVPIGQMDLSSGWIMRPVRGDRFTLGGCDPDSSAPMFFLDVKNRRGAAVELSGKQAGEDLEVALEPCGSATVRFLDGRGKPLHAGMDPAHLVIILTSGASFGEMMGTDQSPLTADEYHASNLDPEHYRDLKTDAEGRITFPTLIPGATYRVVVFNQPEKTQIEFSVKPGEARDLGDLVIRNVRSAG